MNEITLSDKEKKQVRELIECDSWRVTAAFRKIIMTGASIFIATQDVNWGPGQNNILCFHHDLLQGDPIREADQEIKLMQDIPAFVQLLRRLENYDYITINQCQPTNVVVCGSDKITVIPGISLSESQVDFKVHDACGVQNLSLIKDSREFFINVNAKRSYFFTCFNIPHEDIFEILNSSLTINQKLYDYISSNFRTQSDILNTKLDVIDLHIQETKEELMQRFGGLYNALLEHNSTVHSIKHQEPSIFTKLRESLQQKKLRKFKDVLSSLFSSIAYDSIKEADKEGYYHVILHTIFSLIGGFTLNSEMETNNGRIDLVVRLEERTYIFEFKFDSNIDKSEEGLKQSFKYVNAFKNEGKEIVCVGFGFVTDKNYRNVVNIRSATKYSPKKQ